MKVINLPFFKQIDRVRGCAIRETCLNGKHVHMNKNNVDGTGSPLNKIVWISCSFKNYAMTSLSFVNISMTNELKLFSIETQV